MQDVALSTELATHQNAPGSTIAASDDPRGGGLFITYEQLRPHSGSSCWNGTGVLLAGEVAR
jgi:hypothetical protein